MKQVMYQMKNKEFWAREFDRAYCNADVELPSGGGPYGDSWLAGFNFCQKLSENSRDYDAEQEANTGLKPVEKKDE